MATVRKNRGRWVADFRDQNRVRRIEVPQGPFETSAEEKRAARELLQQRLGEVRSHVYASQRERLTFKEVAELWLASKVKIRKSTRDDYQTMLECYLTPYFGQRKIQTISRLDIERFRADMSQEDVHPLIKSARDQKRLELQATDQSARLKPLDPGPRTTNKCLSQLSMIFRYACDHNLTASNVAARMDKLPAGNDEESVVIEENILSPSELQATLTHAADPFRIPIAIAIFCGVRISEVIGLKWSDIDWNRGCAELRRQYREGAFSQLKTYASRRQIELPRTLQSMLQAWRGQIPNEHDLVCPSITGKPMQASALLQRGLRPALERAGIRRVRFHDLRHSFASNLLVAGVDIVTVSKALGHANVHITLTTYAHAVPKPRQGASDRMAELMSQSGNNLETTG